MVLSQKKSIQKKLLAATSMLLVACIMLISASYAWFTLSTAPEIKGITTTIGANGNLEIALADETSWANSGTTIKSEVGDSLLAAYLKNVRWGNLIDASSTTDYGLDKVTLMPAKLNIDPNTGKVNLTSMLLTPSYGADGRIDNLLANTLTATYDREAQKFPTSDSKYGIRAIGTALAMTARQISYRNARGTVANMADFAKVNAGQSLNENGSALANIIVQHATDDTIKYDKSDLATIEAVITKLTTASNNIDSAMKSAIIGMLASKAAEDKGIDATEFELIEDQIEAGNYQVSGSSISIEITVDGSANTITYDMGSAWSDMFAKAKDIKSSIAEAQKGVDDLQTKHTSETEKTIEWTEIRTVLAHLVNPEMVKVNGIATGELKNGENIQTLIDAVTGGQGIQVQMPSGSGVYSDIADFCDDYSAQITLENISYGGLTVKKTTARMTTVSTLDNPYFDTATSALAAAKAPSSAGTTAPTITNTFGYAVDLFFRTNVDNSNLLLQTNAAQRIYGESQNTDTQGSGSNMSFETTSNSFSTEDMRKLMSAIRVVFMDRTGTILANAKLDTAIKTTEGGVTTGGTVIAGSKVTSELKLYEVVDGVEQFKNEQVITALPKNTPIGITALVYLDGELVTNSMVANAAKSMSGSLNLQFASSATLVPMNNQSLFDGSGNTGVSNN